MISNFFSVEPKHAIGVEDEKLLSGHGFENKQECGTHHRHLHLVNKEINANNNNNTPMHNPLKFEDFKVEKKEFLEMSQINPEVS